MKSIDPGIIGNELPTTFHEAKDHAPLSSRGDRSDYRCGGETEEAQLSVFRTRRGVLEQHQVCACLGRQSKETLGIETVHSRSLDGSGYIPMIFI